MKKKTIPALIAMTFLTLSSCSNNNDFSSSINVVEPTKLEVSSSLYRMIAKGKSKKITVDIEPSSLVGKETYKSTDESIAIVDQNGNITPKKIGRCQIVISLGSKSTTCDVVVSSSSDPSSPDKPDPDDPTPTVTATYSKRSGKQRNAFKLNLPTIDLHGINLNLNEIIPIEYDMASNIDVNYLSNNNTLYVDKNNQTDVQIIAPLKNAYQTEAIKIGDETIIASKSQEEQLKSNYNSMYEILYGLRNGLQTLVDIAPAYDTISLPIQYIAAGASYQSIKDSTSYPSDIMFYSNKNDILSLYNNDNDSIRPRFALGKDFLSLSNTDNDSEFASYLNSLSVVLKLLANQGLSISGLLEQIDINTILSSVDYISLLLGKSSIPIIGVTLPALEDGDLIKGETGKVFKEAAKILSVVTDILADGFNIYKETTKYNDFDAIKFRFYLTDEGLNKLNNYLVEVCNEKLPDIIKGKIKPNVSKFEFSTWMYSDTNLKQSHFGRFNIDSDFSLSNDKKSKFYYDLSLDTAISSNADYKSPSSKIKEIVVAFTKYTSKAITAIPFVYGYGRKNDVSITDDSGKNIDDCVSSYSSLSEEVKFMLTNKFKTSELKTQYNKGRDVLNEVIKKGADSFTTMDDVKSNLDKDNLNLDSLIYYKNYQTALKENSPIIYNKIVAIEKEYVNKLVNDNKSQIEKNKAFTSSSSEDDLKQAITDSYNILNNQEYLNLLPSYEFKVDTSKITISTLKNLQELLKAKLIQLVDETKYKSKLFFTDDSDKKNIVSYKTLVSNLTSLESKTDVDYSLYELKNSMVESFGLLMNNNINSSSASLDTFITLGNEYYDKASSFFDRKVTTQSVSVIGSKFDNVPKNISYQLIKDINKALINEKLEPCITKYVEWTNAALKPLRTEGYETYTELKNKTSEKATKDKWNNYKNKVNEQVKKYKDFEEKMFGKVVSDLSPLNDLISDGEELLA